MRYVIHYADGQDEVVPIFAEVDIDDYRVQQPQPLARRTAGLDASRTRAPNSMPPCMPSSGTTPGRTSRSARWTSLPGDSPRGTAALLAVTAARTE